MEKNETPASVEKKNTASGPAEKIGGVTDGHNTGGAREKTPAGAVGSAPTNLSTQRQEVSITTKTKSSKSSEPEVVVIQRPAPRIIPWCPNMVLYMLLVLLIVFIVFFPRYRLEEQDEYGITKTQREVASAVFNIQQFRAARSENARILRNQGDFNMPVLLVVLLCTVMMSAVILAHQTKRLNVQRRKTFAFWIFTVLAIVLGFSFVTYRIYFEKFLTPVATKAAKEGGMSIWRKLFILAAAAVSFCYGMVLYEQHMGRGGTAYEILERKLGFGDGGEDDEASSRSSEEFSAVIIPGGANTDSKSKTKTASKQKTTDKEESGGKAAEQTKEASAAATPTSTQSAPENQ